MTSLPGGAVGSQLGPRSGPPVVTTISSPRRERGAAVSGCLALTGRPAFAVRCFEHQGVAIARYGGVTWACGKRGSWRAGRLARPSSTVLAS